LTRLCSRQPSVKLWAWENWSELIVVNQRYGILLKVWQEGREVNQNGSLTSRPEPGPND
jgi:hypothetical protein